MKLTITVDVELPDDLLTTTDAHAWYLNKGTPDNEKQAYQKTEQLIEDLRREASFRADQYLHNIYAIYQSRVR